ncbi:alpha/beta fold hydrolase [Flavobacterium sp. TSSA_36]|uniref:alpha/beta fold hydrolase n=1 Tax=Flavobacterium sp. TSSA_36 TaxID=3447669 RepID=UPI003F416311
MKKIPVYCMPGLAASSSIFERIDLSKETFEVILLEWEIPLPEETLVNYARRMSLKVEHPNPVLIGVSFGGILVQEMATFLKPFRVIIISSVKSNLEFPRRMKVAKTTKAYKLIPTSLILNVENLAKFSFGDKIKSRLKLYEKFLSVRDIGYLDWAIEQIILWERTVVDANVIHIHGDQDDVFPVKYLSNYIVVPGGNHAMILFRFRWLNEHLPEIILHGKK